MSSNRLGRYKKSPILRVKTFNKISNSILPFANTYFHEIIGKFPQ